MKPISFLLIVILISCTSAKQKTENIQTFARVYGYVRWFYPGDEAVDVDWNRFAVYGIRRVENARNEKELKNTLLELFQPIAPAIQIEEAGKATGFDKNSIIPPDTAGLNVVSWLHYGVYLGRRSNIYNSVRLNKNISGENKICLSYFLPDISNFKGKELKLIASLKSEGRPDGNTYLVLTSMNNVGAEYSYILNNRKTVIKTGGQWKEFECVTTVNPNDTHVVFGFGVDKLMTLWVSNIKLMVKEKNKWRLARSIHQDINENSWQKDHFFYEYKKEEDSNSKKQVFRINFRNQSQANKIGSYLKKDIGNNLICTMPLALYDYKGRTFPVSDSVRLNQLKDHLNNIPKSSMTTEDKSVRLANMIITWNVFQHFYPYFDVVKINWKNELDSALQEVYAGKTEADYFKSLNRLVAKINDGHGVVFTGKVMQWGLPAAFSRVNEKVVVKATEPLNSQFQPGDIVKSIDGKSALEELQEQESLISGSPQLKRYRALNMFGSDFSQSEAQITLIRDGKEIKTKVKRTSRCNLFFNPVSGFPSSKESGIDCGDGIIYEHTSIQNFNEELKKLVKAKGIIISPYCRVFELFPYIIKDTVWSTDWNIPVTARPDRENVIYSSSRWKIEPRKPAIKAKLIFMEEPFNVSSGETALGIIDHYQLGKLVGDTTAGTNGNVNYIELMGGYSVMWTGMKVLKHDGNQLHLIGFRPDYPVKRTIKAIKEGRDEYLEKAKEILKEEIEDEKLRR